MTQENTTANDQTWAVVDSRPGHHQVRRFPVPGGWLYQVSATWGAADEIAWHPPQFVPNAKLAQPTTADARTLRGLHDQLHRFVIENPVHEALDRRIVIRVLDRNDDLHVGGLSSIGIDQGCTETYALVLDADQEPDDPAREVTTDQWGEPVTPTGAEARSPDEDLSDEETATLCNLALNSDRGVVITVPAFTLARLLREVVLHRGSTRVPPNPLDGYAEYLTSALKRTGASRMR
jgi:hypothetical protein